MDLAESSVRLDPRSSFAFQLSPICTPWKDTTRRPWMRDRAVGLKPYDMGARRRLAFAISTPANIAGHQLISMAAQRGNSTPGTWAAVNAFSHYLAGQYDASLSWRVRRSM